MSDNRTRHSYEQRITGDGSDWGEVVRELRRYADDIRYKYNPLNDVFEPDERLSELCGKVADMLEVMGETNGTAGETNGIADEVTLPEGDAVNELREFIDYYFVSGTTAWTQGMALADMFERDYVSRQDFAAQHRTLCAVREQRDELRGGGRVMDEIITTLKEPEFGTWRETHIDYTESLGEAYKSLNIEAYLTNDELIALVRELRGDAE